MLQSIVERLQEGKYDCMYFCVGQLPEVFSQCSACIPQLFFPWATSPIFHFFPVPSHSETHRMWLQVITIYVLCIYQHIHRTMHTLIDFVWHCITTIVIHLVRITLIAVWMFSNKLAREGHHFMFSASFSIHNFRCTI